jgi:AraC family transcriptional regulator of adaptative response/methylated-DNA-[protein]-cysteine methyltransferase
MTDYERIEKVIRYLDSHYLEQPRLELLAEVASLSPFHFHRLFSRWAGVTPKGFLKLLTWKHARALLRESKSLLDVSLDSGLSGPGRLHDLFITIDGVTPGEFKSLGEGVEIRYAFHPTPFGTCLLGQTKRGICHLSFVDGKERASALEELRSMWPNAALNHDSRLTGKAVSHIFCRSSGGQSAAARAFLVGTPFQLKVWEALLKIPPGRLVSYGDIARCIDAPKASRAVGAAVGNNPVAYLIPCHRVIRETGVIGDYRWGAVRKKAMLAWEQTNLSEHEISLSDGLGKIN